MKCYLDLLRHVLENGKIKDNRTGIRTISLFGGQIRIDLENGFPILTTKKVFYRAAIEETLFFIKGLNNNKYLKEKGINIWNEWEKENGDLGPIYGVQWRKWGGNIDQLSGVINEIKINPDSRRLVVSAWNPEDIDKMALPPCHTLYQFYVSEGKLSCHLYQRSADLFLGVPFNIVGYAFLTHVIAHLCGLGVGDLVVSYGDMHIYENHIEVVKQQLEREPLQLSRLYLNFSEDTSLSDIEYNNVRVQNYTSYGTLTGEVAV